MSEPRLKRRRSAQLVHSTLSGDLAHLDVSFEQSYRWIKMAFLNGSRVTVSILFSDRNIAESIQWWWRCFGYNRFRVWVRAIYTEPSRGVSLQLFTLSHCHCHYHCYNCRLFLRNSFQYPFDLIYKISFSIFDHPLDLADQFDIFPFQWCSSQTSAHWRWCGCTVCAKNKQPAKRYWS